MACPTLAVVWRCQKTINHLFVGVGRFIGEKRVGFFRRGRQAGEIEADTRRSSVILSGPMGLILFASNLARTNASIGFANCAPPFRTGGFAR